MTDKLSTSLQSEKLTASEARSQTLLVCTMIDEMRSDEHYPKLKEEVEEKRELFGKICRCAKCRTSEHFCYSFNTFTCESCCIRALITPKIKAAFLKHVN